MLRDTILREYNKMKSRHWDCIYIAIDLHDTCVESDYSYTNTPTNIFEEAIKPLQILSSNSQFKLIMWTCSHPEQIVLYNKVFKDKNIHFDYFNENPEVDVETLIYQYKILLP
jgi:hypothetical protein